MICTFLLPDLAVRAAVSDQAQIEAPDFLPGKSNSLDLEIPREGVTEPSTDSGDSNTQLTLSTTPEYAIAGQPITLTWQLTPGDDFLAIGKVDDQTLEIEAPEKVTPTGAASDQFDAATRTLSVPLKEQGQVAWQIDKTAAQDFTQPLFFSARIRTDKGIFLETPLIVNVAEMFLIDSSGGDAKSNQGQVIVSFPEKALTEPATLQIRYPQSKILTSSLSGQPIEIVAESYKTGEELHKFPEKISISIQYKPEEIKGDESSLTLFYYDEKMGTWWPLGSRVDEKNKTLTGKSDHLSVFDFDTQNWEAAILPNLTNFQVADFTGAASYSFPLQVPPGPGGLQPSLSFSYNSQVVDSATTKTQASWVGMGWSLDTGYIVRNMNGTNEYNGGNYDPFDNWRSRMDDDWKSSGSGGTFTGNDGDDTFSLVLNGQSWELLRIPDTDNDENTIDYRTVEESFWRIRRYHVHYQPPSFYNSDFSYWKIWDKTGTTYYFQENAWYPSWRTDVCQSPFMMTWKWPLSKVQNVYGQEIVYQYIKDRISKNHPWDNACSGYDAVSDVSIYPEYIIYANNHYRIKFVRKNRTDFESPWQDDTVNYTLFERSLLDRVEVWQDPDGTWQNGDDKLIRKYVLGYNYGVVFPNLTWSAGGKTPELASITEYGLNGTGSLPATTFTYDTMHLTQASNGYGGKVTYSYENLAWHESNSSADPLISPNVNDWLYNGTTCGVTAGYDKTMSQPVSLLHPGQVYKFSVRLFSSCLGDYNLLNPTTFGLWLSSDGANKAVASEMKEITYSDSHTGTITGYLRVPSTLTGYGRFYLNVTKNAYIYQYYVWPVLTRDRVATKTTTDQVQYDAQPSAVTFKYDEPVTNDSTHSNYVATNSDYYKKPYTEYLGNAMTQAIQPSGQVNTTFYYQDDNRRGSPSIQFTHSQDFKDYFDSLVSNWWTFANASQSNPEVNGDPALKISNPSTNWDTSAARSTSSLSNGEMMLVQFRLQGSDSAAVLAWLTGTQAQGTYRRWGLYVKNDPGHPAVLQYHDGTNFDPPTYGFREGESLGNIAENTWYSLLLTMDNQQMIVRLWNLDDPGTVQTVKMSTPSSMQDKTWYFIDYLYHGTAWLDSYQEGKLYAMQENLYASQVMYDEISNGIPDIVPPNHKNNQAPYPGLQVTWTRLISDTQSIFNGGLQVQATRRFYHYETAYQGSAQFGNLTQVVESALEGGQFKDYRMTTTAYYPNAGTPYLVGLPGYTNHFRCPEISQNGSCYTDLTGVGSLGPYYLSSHEYLYDDAFYVDGSRRYSPPLVGKLTGERELIRWGGPGLTNPKYSERKYTYDTWGNRATVTIYPGEGGAAPNLADGRITTTTYDTTYHTYPVESVIDWGFLNQIERAKYDYALGVPLVITDTNNIPTSATYDDFGRISTLRKVGDESGNPTLAFSYHIPASPYTNDPFYTQVTQKVDSTNTFTTRKYYNGLGQLLQTQALGASVNGATQDILADTYYDTSGRAYRQSVPYTVTTGGNFHIRNEGQPATYTAYDAFDRPTEVTTPDGTETGYAYQNTLWDGLVYVQTTVTDGNGHSTSTLSDAWGRTARVIPPTGPEVVYTYNESDILTTTVRAGATISLTYDFAGRKTEMHDPDMGAWEYAYDAIGNLTRQEDARGQVTCLYYDHLNRLSGKNYQGDADCPPDPGANYTVWNTYDSTTGVNKGVGRRTGMSDPSGSTAWTYDGRGRVTGTVQTVSGGSPYTTAWTYNSADLPKTMTYPSGETVTFDYNAQLLQQGLSSEAGTYLQNAWYDEAGRVTRRPMNYGALTQSYTYNDWTERKLVGGVLTGQGGRLENIFSTGLQNLGYTYRCNGKSRGKMNLESSMKESF
jgi:YD repeat-containing protein